MTCATAWHRTSWTDDPPFSMIGRRLVNVTSPCRAQQTCGPLPDPEGILPRVSISIFPSKVLCNHKNYCMPLETKVKTRSSFYLKHMGR